MATRLIPESIRDVIDYRPETGEFVWKIDAARRCKAGSKAGSLRKKDGYYTIYYQGHHYGAHRIAWFLMTGEQPPPLVDHEDTNRSNNKWENLRNLSYQANSMNRKKSLVGVTRDRKHDAWIAYIYCGGKREHLYWGADFFEACCRRKSAENRLHRPIIHAYTD